MNCLPHVLINAIYVSVYIEAGKLACSLAVSGTAWFKESVLYSYHVHRKCTYKCLHQHLH